VSGVRVRYPAGEGERSCAWGDCAYLPEELNVLCDYRRFNFFTMEGNSPCGDPLRCEHAAAPSRTSATSGCGIGSAKSDREGDRRRSIKLGGSSR